MKRIFYHANDEMYVDTDAILTAASRFGEDYYDILKKLYRSRVKTVPISEAL